MISFKMYDYFFLLHLNGARLQFHTSMKGKRGRPPQHTAIKSWLTQDFEKEEIAPWVRINILKTHFRPPTLFDFENRNQHEIFDEETTKIKEAYDREASLAKKRKATRRQGFWQIVNQIESAGPVPKLPPLPREEEEEDTAPVDLRSKYLRDRRR